MKSFLRKRTNSISTPSPAIVSTPAPLAPAETPLYARFASPQRGQDRPVVSGPIALGPRKPAQSHAPPPPQAPAPVPRGSSPQKTSRTLEEPPRGILKKTEQPREESERGSGGQEELELELELNWKQEREREQERGREAKRTSRSGDALAGWSARGGGGDGTAAVGHPERTDGERVLLPARKVARRADAVKEGASPERSRGLSPDKEPASSSGPGPDAVGDRVLLPARKVAHKASTRLEGSSGRRIDEGGNTLTGERSRTVASPSTSGTSTSSAQVVVMTASPDGWEEKFSTPKRAQFNVTTSPTSLRAASPSPSRPVAASHTLSPLTHSPRDRRRNLSPEKSAGPSVPSPQTHSPRSARKKELSPEKTSRSHRKAGREEQPAAQDGRVLLPARKVTRRVADTVDDSAESPVGPLAKSSAVRPNEKRASLEVTGGKPLQSLPPSFRGYRDVDGAFSFVPHLVRFFVCHSAIHRFPSR